VRSESLWQTSSSGAAGNSGAADPRAAFTGVHTATTSAATAPSEPVLPVSMKIVVAGGYAVGKTTLVSTISEIEPLRTEADITVESLGIDFAGPVQGQKTGTTVAMDFGRITLGPDMVL
jgi:GTPase SAR1 family protein